MPYRTIRLVTISNLFASQHTFHLTHLHKNFLVPLIELINLLEYNIAVGASRELAETHRGEQHHTMSILEERREAYAVRGVPPLGVTNFRLSNQVSSFTHLTSHWSGRSHCCLDTI